MVQLNYFGQQSNALRGYSTFWTKTI